MTTIHEHLSKGAYKTVARFYRDVKSCGKVQKLYMFLNQEVFYMDENVLVEYIKREILLSFSYYKEKPLREQLRGFRGKRKQQ